MLMSRIITLTPGGVLLFALAGCSTPSPREQGRHEAPLSIDTSAPATPRRVTADTAPLDAYLAALEVQLIEFSDSLHERLRQVQRSADRPDRADSVFLAVRAWYREFGRERTAELEQSAVYEHIRYFNPDVFHQIRELVREYGYDLFFSEGHAWLASNYIFLHRLFAPYLSPGSAAVLAQMAAEQGLFIDDGAVRASWDELAERISAWERILATHGSFALRREARSWHRTTLEIYFTGLDNSPIFDHDTYRVRPSVRQSYERSVVRFADADWTVILREFLQLLAQHDFVIIPEVNEFYQAKRFRRRIRIPPDGG